MFAGGRSALHVRSLSVSDDSDRQPGGVRLEGDNYLWRIVNIGTARPKNLKPTWLGDAVGHYEGDTLIVDVTGFNGLAWLDQAGHATSDQLHLTERYTRTDSLTLKYEVTIDDPGGYSKPWTASNTVHWRPGMELMESICQEDEKKLDSHDRERAIRKEMKYCFFLARACSRAGAGTGPASG